MPAVRTSRQYIQPRRAPSYDSLSSSEPEESREEDIVTRRRLMGISIIFLRHLAIMVFAAAVGWPAPRTEFVAQTGHTNAVDAIAFSRDGSLLASGGHDAIIKLWDVRSGSELRALAGHTNTITALVFSKDGKTVVSGGLDSTVRFWDVASGNIIRTINRSV